MSTGSVSKAPIDDVLDIEVAELAALAGGAAAGGPRARSLAQQRGARAAPLSEPIQVINDDVPSGGGGGQAAASELREPLMVFNDDMPSSGSADAGHVAATEEAAPAPPPLPLAGGAEVLDDPSETAAPPPPKPTPGATAPPKAPRDAVTRKADGSKTGGREHGARTSVTGATSPVPPQPPPSVAIEVLEDPSDAAAPPPKATVTGGAAPLPPKATATGGAAPPPPKATRSAAAPTGDGSGQPSWRHGSPLSSAVAVDDRIMVAYR